MSAFYFKFHRKNKILILSGALLVLIFSNVVFDKVLFSQKEISQKETLTGTSLLSDSQNGRYVASNIDTNRKAGAFLKFSWEQKAFEVLSQSNESLVIKGVQPTSMDRFIFEDLGGQYQVLQKDGQVKEIHFNGNASDQNQKGKNISNMKKFLEKNLNFFSDRATLVKRTFVKPENKDVLGEKFELLSSSNQNVGQIHVLLDKNQSLISIRVKN